MSTRLTLRPTGPDPRYAVEAEVLTVDRLAGLSAAALARLPIVVGNRAEPLGDLFRVEGDGAEEIVVEGDLSRFALVGAGQTRGTLRVLGPVGPGAGSGLAGGALLIEGDAGERAGEGMRGGVLRIGGAAGALLGAPRPGERRGIDRGVILVEGRAGPMAGYRMRRGTVAVLGEAGEGAGTGMIGGTMILAAGAGGGAGALMTRGTIVLGRPQEPLPTFRPSGRGTFSFLRPYRDALAAAGAAGAVLSLAGGHERYVGDLAAGGLGEILIAEGRP